MNTQKGTSWLLVLGCALVGVRSALGADANPPPPAISGFSVTNGQQRLSWTPYPAVDEFRILSTPDFSAPFTNNGSGVVAGYQWTAPLAGPGAFHRLEVTPLSSNALLAATVLNRLAYGPTPDELERVLTGTNAIGAAAFIEEQLSPETINDTLDFDLADTNIAWVQVIDTGTATSSNLFLYLSGAGSVYVDDIRLVRGTDLNGLNLLNTAGDFEATLSPPWLVSSNFTGSRIASETAHSGQSSLQVVATASGSGNGNSIQMPFARSNSATQEYTLSFWYLPDPAASNVTVTARLSGSDTTASAAVRPPTLPAAASTVYAALTNGTASLSDLRAWHIQHAVKSKRQLLEVLLQFFDNHFNTQYDKTREWFDNNYARVITNQNQRAWLAVNFEFRELEQWRTALLNPNCTFYDLLKISAESPAMVIYLDSVLSSKNRPNENYPRELFELFAMGSDNGYTQTDINELSKAWTGVRVTKKAPENAGDVFAPPVADITNSVGTWVLHFSTNNHNTTVKRIFTESPIAARFGPPYAGQPYSLILSNGTGTNGWRDITRVIEHVADLPYTQEFISVKLCRWFVHENFELGVYDYAAPDLAPEAQLIKDCMETWRTPAADGRQGNIRALLRTIFDSALFRGHGASQQKAKTPIEFAVSAVRALRASDGNGKFTADTDGYALTGTSGGGNNSSALNRMGGMVLFNRPEPDGWPEFGRLWLNTANLCERMRFCHHLLMRTGDSKKDDDYTASGTRNVTDPVQLIRLKLPEAKWTDAAAVVDYFLGILYPGEGRANLDDHRRAAIEFLNTNEAAPPASALFGDLSVSSTVYDGRVRGMVGLLMTYPRFQEQ